MRWTMAALLVVMTGCGGSSPSGPSPAPSPAAPPAPAPPPSFTGTVTDTATGAPVAGFTAVLEGSRVTVSAPGYQTRVTNNRPMIDLIRLAPPFDLEFYRKLVRNTHEAPGSMEPLRRQASPTLRVYVRTVDERGDAIDSTSLATVTGAITPVLVESFSGGRVTLAGVETGAETRSGPGWIMVRWLSEMPDDRCGQAAVGGDWIELRYESGRCGCRNTGRTYPRLVKHELGHAMGYWHTDDRNDLMFNATTNNDCDNNPSERERFHARIAYSRPIGNRDPDIDPVGPASLRPVVVR